MTKRIDGIAPLAVDYLNLVVGSGGELGGGIAMAGRG